LKVFVVAEEFHKPQFFPAPPTKNHLNSDPFAAAQAF
jgi:hypothetical protein